MTIPCQQDTTLDCKSWKKWRTILSKASLGLP